MSLNGTRKARLLVLDNDRYQKLFEAILGRDYELIPTNDPKKAVALALSELPDVILLRNSVEDTEGITAAKEIREAGSLMVPIVLMLTADRPTLRREAEKAGCNGFLIKPLDPDKIKSQIEIWLKAKARAG